MHQRLHTAEHTGPTTLVHVASQILGDWIDGGSGGGGGGGDDGEGESGGGGGGVGRDQEDCLQLMYSEVGGEAWQVLLTGTQVRCRFVEERATKLLLFVHRKQNTLLIVCRFLDGQAGSLRVLARACLHTHTHTLWGV